MYKSAKFKSGSSFKSGKNITAKFDHPPVFSHSNYQKKKVSGYMPSNHLPLHKNDILMIKS